MKIFDRFKKTTEPQTEDRTINFESVFGSAKPNTSTKLNINGENSLELSAIWSAVDQISNSVAKLPLSVYRRSKGGKIEDTNHDIYKLLNKPNPYLTKFDFFKTMVTNLLLYGNAYAWIDRGIGNKVNALWLLSPNAVGVNLSPDGRQLIYSISINGKASQVSYKDMLHFKRISLDGYNGKSPINLCRESIAIAKVSNQFLGSYYGNGTSVMDILETDQVIKVQGGKDMIREAWQEINSGPNNAGKIAILDMGLKHKQIDKNMVNMDFINTQKFYSVEEVARLFNIPSTMLGDLSKATFSNVENLNLLYYKNCVSPILYGIENELDDKLFAIEEPVNTKFDMSEELRGDTAARTAYYESLEKMGAITPNEIRAEEGFTPMENPAMDETYMTLNNAPISTIKEYQLSKNPINEGQRKSKSNNSESEVETDGQGNEKSADTTTN